LNLHKKSKRTRVENDRREKKEEENVGRKVENVVVDFEDIQKEAQRKTYADQQCRVGYSFPEFFVYMKT
jgi:hypothetical protein